MKRTFLFKTLNLLLVCAILLCYQRSAVRRAREVSAWEKESEEARAAWETYYETAMTETESAASEAEALWQDGVWQGSGAGFGGEILMQVEIAEGRIRAVSILSADGETSSYLDMAEALTEEIVDAQSADIDAVSGATFSSRGILDGVSDALEKAKKGQEATHD